MASMVMRSWCAVLGEGSELGVKQWVLDSRQTKIPPKIRTEIWRELVSSSSLCGRPGEPTCSEGAIWHAWVGPTGRWYELRDLGWPVGEGSNRNSMVSSSRWNGWALPADGGAVWLRPWPGGPELPAVG